MSGLQARPLSALTMEILLALAEEELHGYALMQAVEAQTGGALVPGTGSLYAALQRLEDDGLVEESPMRPASGEDERRRYYRITAAGRAAAREEARRLIRVLEMARERSLIGRLPWPRGAR